MKDFNAFLKDQKHYTDKAQLPPAQTLQQAEKLLKRDLFRDKLIKFSSPIILSLLTSPMAVASIFLQMSPKSPTNPIQDKLTLQRQRNLPIQPRFISNGIYGDNKIYQPQSIKGYRHAFETLGQQGVLGYYKGNMTQLVLATINSSVRAYCIALMAQQKYSEKITNAASIVICSCVDALTTPLMTIQSRLILQNRLPNFRTYRNPITMLGQIPMRELFRGWLIHFPKNLAMIFSWFNLVKESPLNSFVLSSALAHITTYPFTTVMRIMQVQSNDPMMLGKQYKNSWECTKSLWNSSGIRGFYRGFGCYAVVHTFTTALMVQINMRSGFFVQF